MHRPFIRIKAHSTHALEQMVSYVWDLFVALGDFTFASSALCFILFTACLFLFLLRFVSACNDVEEIYKTLHEIRSVMRSDSEVVRLVSSKHLAFIEEWRRGMGTMKGMRADGIGPQHVRRVNARDGVSGDGNDGSG